MPDTLHDKIIGDLDDRKKWEERQPVWYRMRHQGLGRKSKPYPTAPDFHFPLADTLLEKLQPFYYKQLFASEMIAELVSQRPQLEEYTEHAARWFDYQVKEETDLLEEILCVIDMFLLSGVSVCRPTWNPKERRIEHLAIPPTHLIVPSETTRLEKASRVVHVELISREEYARRPGYRQDKGFVDSIAGTGTGRDGHDQRTDDERQRREGITHCGSRKFIVIWNVWEKTERGWVLHTRSPHRPKPEDCIRPTLRNPYEHGLLPFVDFRREIKERGFYSSRGEVEKVAPFESYLCKLWNKKGEALDFFATPIFTSDDEGADGKSFVFNPGQFIPRGIQRVDMGQPPFALDQEMNQVRGIAEQRAVMPDFGIGDQTATSGKRTATEVEQLASLGGVTTELRAHIFRLSLQRVLQQDWRLLLQYKRRELDYLVGEQPASAPAAALHDAYRLKVGGTAESWNKRLEAQKAFGLYDRGKGDPYFDQLELRKLVVEKTDPRWVKRLVRDPQQQANDEAVDEMVKVPAIMEGAPIPVEPQENHPVRAEIIYTKLQQLGAMGVPVDPIAQQALTARLNQRLQVWQQVDPKAARAWWRQKQAELKAAAQAAQPQSGGNVLPFAQPAAQPSPAMPLAAGGAR